MNHKSDVKVKKSAFIWDLAVIGAGASGMMAAITAARHGKRVILLEQKDRCGKKLSATGNGKCNFTNEDMQLSCFYGNQTLAEAVLGRFSKEDTLRFFREIGIVPKSRNGYYYPNSEQASSVITALLLELKRLGVTIVNSARLLAAEKTKDGFVCRLQDASYACRKLLFATGLRASPKLGSDGSAFSIIKGFGHRFMPIVPALCGCYCNGADFKKMAGVRADARLSLFLDGQPAGVERGELQLTDYGLSGIPVFQLSRLASMALYEKKQVEIQVDFLPDIDWDVLLMELKLRLARFGELGSLWECFHGLLHQKILCALLGTRKTLSDKELPEFAGQLKNLSVLVEQMRDFEFAQVCAGGIRTEEIHMETLESKLVPGLYFCGELLDVDGICGGYNLQWAWSSGYAAGLSAASEKSYDSRPRNPGQYVKQGMVFPPDTGEML